MAQDDRTQAGGSHAGGTQAGRGGGAPAARATPKPSPGEFIRQVRSETSKVVWPTRPETGRTAIFVGIMVVILSIFFLGVDSLFGTIVRWLLALL